MEAIVVGLIIIAWQTVIYLRIMSALKELKDRLIVLYGDLDDIRRNR